MKTILASAVLTCAAVTAVAAPVTFQIDPAHTYPSFEADHMGGLSIWRGKFKRSSGTIVLDKENGTGTIDVTVDISSVDFGHDEMNENAKKPQIFDAVKYPTATYKGTLTGFKNGAPTLAQGEFTLRGVTKPLTLQINQFLCITNPMSKEYTCGADASATFNRADYGLDYPKGYNFKMWVKLAIQVEAIRQD